MTGKTSALALTFAALTACAGGAETPAPEPPEPSEPRAVEGPEAERPDFEGPAWRAPAWLGGVASLSKSADGRAVYVAATSHDRLAAFGFEDEALVLRESIAVGQSPGHVVVDGGGRVFVSNGQSSSVSVVSDSGEGLSMLGTLRVGAGPGAMNVIPGGDLLLVLCRGDATLHAIDLAGLGTRWVAQLPERPRVLYTDGDIAYVGHGGEGRVTAVDTTDGDVEWSIELPPGPGVASRPLILHPNGSGVDVFYRLVDLRDPAAPPRPTQPYYAPPPSQVVGSAAFERHEILGLVNETLGASPVEQSAIGNELHLPSVLTVDADSGAGALLSEASEAVVLFSGQPGRDERRIDLRPGARSVMFLERGRFLMVDNGFEHELTLIETSQPEVSASLVAYGEPVLNEEERLGRRLFATARLDGMTQSGTVTCADCHPGGRDDGLIYDTPNGPRNTPSLVGGLDETYPLHWNGDIADHRGLQSTIVDLMGGSGLTNEDLDALGAYMNTLAAPDNPLRTATDPTTIAAVELGAEQFEQECATCHAGPAYVDGQQHDVGTGGTFDTPTLRGVFASPPYLHDGRADTIHDAVTSHALGAELEPHVVRAIVTFVETL